jgi:hypothetical protein
VDHWKGLPKVENIDTLLQWYIHTLDD